MTRETLATLSALLLPVAVTALAGLAAWATRALSRWIKDRRVALALEVIANGGAAIVADLAQHVVSDLKNPTKPGTWDDIAKATVRERAVERIKLLYPQAVALAREALADPKRLNDLLGTVVEKAVVEIKSKGGLISAGTIAGSATVNVSVEAPDAAPTSDAERDTPPSPGRSAHGSVGRDGE